MINSKYKRIGEELLFQQLPIMTDDSECEIKFIIIFWIPVQPNLNSSCVPVKCREVWNQTHNAENGSYIPEQVFFCGKFNNCHSSSLFRSK